MVAKPKSQKPDTSEFPALSEAKERLSTRKTGRPKWMNFQVFVGTLLLVTVLVSVTTFILTLRAQEARRIIELERIERTQEAVDSILVEIQREAEVNLNTRTEEHAELTVLLERLLDELEEE